MALQVWLPLNGKIENQGISGATPSGSPASWGNGPIGKCGVFTGQKISIPYDIDSKQLTITFWFYPDTPGAWCDVFSIGAGDNRFEVSKTTRYYWYADKTPLISSGSVLGEFSNNKWYHIGFVITGEQCLLYINGTLQNKYTQTNQLSTVLSGNRKIMLMSRIAGIKLTAVKRTLLVPSRNFPVELLFLRDDDIPDSVATGTADIGIVGLNEVLEKQQEVEVICRLGFSKCRLSLAIPKEVKYDGIEWFNGKKIATSYPKILIDFMRERGITADVHVISGSVEIAPGIGLSDAIFDIVSSGSTLVSNNLAEVETVLQSEAVLIGNGGSLSAEKQEILDELLFRIEAVKAAEGKKYILMNVPKAKLADVLAVLPGIKSPTVLPLADEEWCSVHTVLPEKHFWEIINALKGAGAEGLLVLNIEKMVL